MPQPDLSLYMPCPPKRMPLRRVCWAASGAWGMTQCENDLFHDLDTSIWRSGKKGRSSHGGCTLDCRKHLSSLLFLCTSRLLTGQYLVCWLHDSQPPRAPHIPCIDTKNVELLRTRQSQHQALTWGWRSRRAGFRILSKSGGASRLGLRKGQSYLKHLC